MRKKNVTWSPVVVSVNRPSRRRVKKKRHTNSTFFMHLPNGEKTLLGQLVAHSRRDTHSLLLTMRNAVHRDLQFLIDLPEQRIRRIYDGRQSWNVRTTDATERMTLYCKLGTIVWADDGELRNADARGFNLAWLNGKHCIAIAAASSKRKSSRRSRRRRRSRRV